MKISDIKGAFAQRLKTTTSKVLNDLVKDFIKTKFDYESSFIEVEEIDTVSRLKCVFKDGLSSSSTYYSDNYIRSSDFYVSRIGISQKWPNVQICGTYEKTHTGKYKYINYEITMYLQRRIEDHFGNLRCVLSYKFTGDLDEALNYCPYEIKKDFVYKDVNDVEIKKFDDIIYIRGGELRQGTVIEFKENLIITDGCENIYVDEYIKNKHVIVANCRFTFAGGIRV